MAIYRLETYPEAPAGMLGKRARFAFWLGASLLAAAGCVPLMFFAHTLADRLRLPAQWLGNAIGVLFGVALTAALLCGLLLFNRRKYLRDYGRQWCQLTPEGLTYSGPGQPECFTPADALLSFSVRQGSTSIRAAEPFKGALLPPELADRDALWNELRNMGVPELPAHSAWADFGKSMLPLVPLLACCAEAFAVKSITLKLLCCAPYLLWTARMQWKAERRKDPEQSPFMRPGFYAGVVSSVLWLVLLVLPLHGHRRRP